ncbi:MAG: 4-hydroxy-tetrahydrodipicolinate synthase [Actinomycetota bacterium]
MRGRFGAVLTAMATPFTRDGALDLPGVEALADHLLRSGSDGLVVAGSTGEAPTLTHDEKDALFRAAVGAAGGRGPVLCGAGTNATAESLELARLAEKAGADGLLLVTPYYNRPPQRGLVEHFSAIARSVDLPVMLYNVPGRTATRIEHATLLELASVPNVVAIKDSTGDLQGASRLIAELPDDVEVYAGDYWAAFSLALLGAAGVVSVASHVVGPRIATMLVLVGDGRVAEARAIHEDLTPVFDALFITSNPIPLKAALRSLGLPGGDPRLPLVPATPAEVARVEEALRSADVR